MHPYMSILDAYDPSSSPLIKPESFYQKGQHITDTCVVCFSYRAYHYVLDHYEHVLYMDMHATANGPIQIHYLPKYNVLFFMSLIGAPIASGILQEIAYIADIKRFVYFGSCGVLDESVRGKVIVPSACYREEGYSYHYCPPSEYLEMEHYQDVAAYMQRHHIDHVVCKGWTTDAIYNETKRKCALRKQEGVLCVDMEATGLQAIASYIGVDLYIFFFGADILGEVWIKGDKGGDPEHLHQQSASDIAIGLAAELQNN